MSVTNSRIFRAVHRDIQKFGKIPYGHPLDSRGRFTYTSIIKVANSSRSSKGGMRNDGKGKTEAPS